MTEKNALTTLANMKISTRARQMKHANEELAPGIAAPFAVIGYKGGHWSIRHRGNVTELERKTADGRPDGYEPFIHVVMLHAAPHHSKVYYEKPYVDGNDDPPDCWSTDGIKPDQAAPKKQSVLCANCPKNTFGSRINQATGAKGKACSDFRRIAVVPYPNLENEVMGGVMLLRVPPASLANYGEYSDFLKANSVPYCGIVTKIGFEKGVAYPKMQFEPEVALTDSEVDRAAAMQALPIVDRMVQQQLENLVDRPGAQEGSEVQPRLTVVGGTPVPQPPQGPEKPKEEVPPKEASTLPPTPPTPPAPKPEAVALTPEQIRVKELELELARLKAAQPVQPKRRRSQPVAPQAEAQTLPPPETADDGTGDDAEDPALAAINARLDKVMQ